MTQIGSISGHDAPPVSLRARILSHLQLENSQTTRALLLDILDKMEAPYDMSWIRDEFKLSPAEYEVLQLLVQGKNAQHISELTGKQVSTVRAQIHKAYTKCRVSNMAELIALLLRRARNI